MRLNNASVVLPPRLNHMQNLPWFACYMQTLKAENKSKNTQKSYASGLRALIETTLPDENVLSESNYQEMTVLELAERMEPLLSSAKERVSDTVNNAIRTGIKLFL